MNEKGEIKIGEHIRIVPGFPFNSQLFNDDGEGLPLIRIRDLLKSKVETFFSGEYSNEFLISKGDILIGMDGDFHIVRWNNRTKALLNQRIMKVAQKEGALIDINYFYFFLFPFLKDVWYKTTATTVKHLSTFDIADALVKFPSFTEQTHIAKILSTCDAVIEKTEAAIAKYQAIKQGMLQDLFIRGIDITTNKLRPRYEDAPDLYKESKLGMIPKEWNVEAICDCITPTMSNVDKHIKEDETKVFLCNYMDVYSNRYLTKEISFSNGSVNASEMQRFSLHPQDVIITKDSETPDDIAVPAVLIEKIENLICGYHLCILRSNDLSKLNGEFIMLQLQLHEINKQFSIRANGSTRYGLTIDAIADSFLKVPSDINEQIEIVKRLRSIDAKLKAEQSYLFKQQQIKFGLMNDLLSGKKLVKVAEELVTQNEN
jgi:type I restriction enzyme S subunit